MGVPRETNCVPVSVSPRLPIFNLNPRSVSPPWPDPKTLMALHRKETRRANGLRPSLQPVAFVLHSFRVAAKADQGDVVELGAAGGVVTHGREDRFAHRRHAAGSLGKLALKPGQAEFAVLPVAGVGHPVGIDDHRVAGLENDRDWLISHVVHRAQRRTSAGAVNLFDLAIGVSTARGGDPR